ncbi:MAG: exosortase K [Acidobacteria bacterium]|nr:exosortase K [Acidobacteriota bacterium]
MKAYSLDSRRSWRAAAGWLFLYGAGFLIALGLKLHYSRAGADELVWILAPTSHLAGLLTGDHFEREPRSGWISHASRMILGPGCAGVNFLIIAFSAFFFSFVGRLKSPATRVAWLAASLGGAYLLALATNALRIITAIRLHELDVYGDLITPQRVHRAEGAVVYCVALLLAHLFAERTLARLGALPPRRPAFSPWVPLGWYVGMALGVPLLVRVYRGGDGPFVEHSALVLLVCLSLALVLRAPRVAGRGTAMEGDPGSESPRSRC